jgi:hypothetical protein
MNKVSVLFVRSERESAHPRKPLDVLKTRHRGKRKADEGGNKDENDGAGAVEGDGIESS